MKLNSEKIGNVLVDIEVDPNGMFSATFDGEDYREKTREQLLEKVKAAVRKAKRARPVDVSVLDTIEKPARKTWDTEYFMDGLGIVDAKLRGHHERNRRWLLTEEGGQKRKFNISTYEDSEKIVRRLTDEEKRRWFQLKEAERLAAVALEDFLGVVKVDPAELLEAAQAPAAAEA